MRVFLSTPSARRATPKGRQSIGHNVDFYPRPPRGGRLVIRSHHELLDLFLSTPSARRATTLCAATSRPAGYFYPRPPRGGRRKKFVFNSWESYFYPRPPRGGRPLGFDATIRSCHISIHALREEGDVDGDARTTQILRFLSTPSARRATHAVFCPRLLVAISIHALREEGDYPAWLRFCGYCYFYPRPPRGGRRHTSM